MMSATQFTFLLTKHLIKRAGVTSMNIHFKATRAGAFWILPDGTRLMWDDDHNYFQNCTTGEVYEVIERISEDKAIVG